MGIGNFLGDLGNGIKHGLDKTVEGLNVVDRYINPFHEEQTITPGGEAAAEAAQQSGASQPRGILSPGLEDTMSGMRWLYSNAISEPLATAALVGKMNRGKNDFFGGDYFSTAAWNKAYEAAQHISPGQALSMDPEEASRAIDSPLLYYKPPEAYLPPGFSKLPQAQQQQILKEAGMPAIGNAYVEKLRQGSSWFKYGTGALDFSSVVFLDPTGLALGAASKTKALATSVKMPKGGWSEAQIDELMGKTQMQKLMDGIWANKDNPQLLNNTELAKRSGMGPRFGAIASRLKDPDELSLFVRTGMGDMRAMEELSARNAEAAIRLRGTTSRLSSLGLMRERYSSLPATQNLVDAEIARVQAAVNADVDLVARYDSIMGNPELGIPSAMNQIDQLYYTRWADPMRKASDITAAQNQYRAGPARGAGAGRPVEFTPGKGPINAVGYEPTPISGGFVKTNLWGVGDYFSGPVTMVRALKNSNPNGYIRLDTVDRDSVNELRGHLARIPGIKEETRNRLLNAYLSATTEAERLGIVKDDIGLLGVHQVAKKHGLDGEDALALYQKHLDLKQGAVDRMKQYTGALDPERMGASGQPLHLDELMDTGGKVHLTPFTASRLVNGHTFQDLDLLDKVLSRHASRLKTLRVATGSARDAVEAMADSFNQMWKFTTLFRLGYIPRVLGDDLAGQWAAAGTAAMAVRGYRGVTNLWSNAKLWQLRPALQAREAMARAGAEYADDEIARVTKNIRELEQYMARQTASRDADLRMAFRRHQAAQGKLAQLDEADLSKRALATRTFARQREQQLRQAEARVGVGGSPGKNTKLQQLRDRNDFLKRYRDLTLRQADDFVAQQQKVIQGSGAVTMDGHTFPAAFGGGEGEYLRKLVSSDESVGNMFATNNQLLRGNLERSFDHGGQTITAVQDEVAHAEAWARAINVQIMQDPLSRMAVQGKTLGEMVKWLKTDARGIAYRRRMPKMIPEEEFARSAYYEVNQYLHTPEIRMKALEPGGVTPDFLKKAVPHLPDRPQVHQGRIGQSQLGHAKALDRIIQKWYHGAATLPADRMSRHPLFNQFYEGHLKKITAQRKLNNRANFTAGEIDQIAHSARYLALRDMRALVFDIAHRSDAAAATRFMSPFFAATSESFQRWGRILADKPQTLGYAANWYNSPAYLGAMQDMDGNHIDGEGYSYVPQWQLKPDGTPDYSKKPKIIKRLVPKSERYIVTRVPKWVAGSLLGKAFNITEAGGQLAMSQNSIDLVTQGDPWFNPGVGPIVQIPVNEFVRDKPHAAQMARELGILPFGVQGGTLFGETPLGRAATLAIPAQFRNALTSMDTSDQRYQQIKLQVLQREIYDFTQKHDGVAPTEAQIGAMQKRAADKTSNYWKFAAFSAFLQPFATQRHDKFQFYRDQYNGLRRQNPLTADDEFLSRYGESFFVFAQESSDSSGIPPTMKAVELSKKYAKELARNPDLAPLVIGPEGNGPFSREAYAYQLNNPLVPGGAEMQRTKLSADEAVKENQRRLGWAKYTARMNQLNAQLRAAGFQSFSDEGAEQFADDKKAWASLYAEPLYPDGSVNPYYNAEWSKDYFTQDRRKYERLIPDLTYLANSDLAKQPARSDLRMLQQYLGGRQALVQALAERKAQGLHSTLAAQANVDLRNQWIRFVDQLIEADTRFGDLYHRYLSRDMDVDVEEEAQ